MVSAAFMHRFKRSPIIELEIGPLETDENLRDAQLGADEPSPLSVGDLRALLDGGAMPELQRLTLIGATAYDDVDAIRDACTRRRIAYTFELEDLSDVEDDEDDEDDFDGFDDNLSEQSWQTEEDDLDGDGDLGSDGSVDDFGE